MPPSSVGNEDGGMSSVVGVLLTIAIAVVLGAIVFVMVDRVKEDPDARPAIAFQREDEGITILKASPQDGLTYAAAAGDPGLHFRSPNPLCQLATVNGEPLVAGQMVRGGDSVKFTGCSPGDIVHVIHAESGRLVYAQSW